MLAVIPCGATGHHTHTSTPNMIPQRLQATYRKLGHIPAWLLTTPEYRILLHAGWKRSVGSGGGFVLSK